MNKFLLLFIVSVCFISFQSFLKSNIDEIDCFICVKKYIKKSLFHICYSQKVTQQTKARLDMEILDKSINRIAKEISKTMKYRFQRTRSVLDKIQTPKDSFSLFLLPDTLLEKSKVHYYKFLLDTCYKITGDDPNKLSNIDSKMHIEKLYS
jgi:hypothetical protein